MKSFISKAALAIALLVPAISQAEFISGDVTGGGSFLGTVTRSNAWAESNPVDGTEVNFWSLSGSAGDSLSITIDSTTIEFGVSVYQGLVEAFDLISPGFDNAASFGENLFVTGTPFFGANGTQLLNVLLPASGIYTIAVGGEQLDFGTEYDYSMSVGVAPVPLPAAAWLFASALLGAGILRRRRVA